MPPTPMAYFRGEFIPVSEAKVGVMTHALHYGTAVFEGIRGNWNAEEEKTFIFKPKQHFHRFLDSCKMLRISIPFDEDALVKLSVDLVERSGLCEDVYIRPLAYKSSEKVANLKLHELDDGLTIMAVPLGRYIDSEMARCTISSWRRMDENMIPPSVKISGLYVNSILAKTDAVLAGFDEAIMLNLDGTVAEGTGENLFIVKDNTLITPPLYSNVLPGITRDCVIQIAKDDLGIETMERPIKRGELYLADELFLSGTAAHLTPVGEVDNRLINNGGLGPVTQKLQDIYFEAIRGKIAKYRDWCVQASPSQVSKV